MKTIRSGAAVRSLGLIFFIVCASRVEAQPIDAWKYPCEEYARIALKYFAECEESGGISRATNAAFGHFALDMYRECRKASGTTYFFPEKPTNNDEE